MASSSQPSPQNHSLLSCIGSLLPGQPSHHYHAHPKGQKGPQLIRSRNNSPLPHTATSNEMKQTEDYLASEFNKLSSEERSKALEDLYCAGADNCLVIDETPSLIENSLAQFELALQQGNFPIYQAALHQNRCYVEDSSLRLRFLRSNFFNVAVSVDQMVDFLNQKATYFGIDKVARDITLDDLTAEELDLMLSGRYHIQDGTDPKGRVILYAFCSAMSNCQDVAMVNRINYYIWFNILIANPVVQKKGVVAVFYDAAKSGEPMAFPGLDVISKGMRFLASLPIRYSAVHLCFGRDGSGNAALKNFFLGVCLKSLSQHTRVRTAVHHGSDMEIQYQLRKKHGFPDTFPVDNNGKLRQDLLNVWFHLHMANDLTYAKTFNRILVREEDDADMALTSSSSEDDEEESSIEGHEPKAVVNGGTSFAHNVHISASNNNHLFAARNPSNRGAEPTVNDVLLGRGRDIQNNPGNIYFREFLARYQNDYDRLPRHKRGKMASDLTKILRSRGIRFFQRTGSEDWEETTSRVAEKKVGQLLREFRKKKVS